MILSSFCGSRWDVSVFEFAQIPAEWETFYCPLVKLTMPREVVIQDGTCDAQPGVRTWRRPASRATDVTIIMTRAPYRCAVGLMIKTDEVSEQGCSLPLFCLTNREGLAPDRLPLVVWLGGL